MTTRKIQVCPYDERWGQAFEMIKGELLNALGTLAIGVEHVGSTAVKGLWAKPIIDIDIIIESGTLGAVVAALEKAGYYHEGDLGIKGREAFGYEGKEHLQKHHLYVCERGAEELKRHTAFRDYLRAHPEAAEEYSRIKREGAERYPDDIEGYIRHKAGVISRIYEEAGSTALLLNE